MLKIGEPRALQRSDRIRGLVRDRRRESRQQEHRRILRPGRILELRHHVGFVQGRRPPLDRGDAGVR